MLGKAVTIAANGLPSAITISSDPLDQHKATEALASAVRFEITMAGSAVRMRVDSPAHLELANGGRAAVWNASWSTAGGGERHDAFAYNL